MQTYQMVQVGCPAVSFQQMILPSNRSKGFSKEIKEFF
jgi:hypothetical protein